MISTLPYILNNRFELDRELGAGGMGVVYLARDLRLNRPVAVKVLRSEYSADAVVLGRFRHEADRAAQLGHPNIVRVYDVGVHEGLSYIVMEYIAGQTLRTVIDEQGALPVHRVFRLASQIAEALVVVHQSGCVHRDIKPQNILLDSEDRVHLTDFGIAKSAQSAQYTRVASPFGLVEYMAPELIEDREPTICSDIYSAGIVFYEMLSGQVPFTGNHPMAIARKHLDAPIPSLPRHIPKKLETLIQVMLAKTPEQRPESMMSVRAELFRLRNDLVSSLDQAPSPAPSPAPSSAPSLAGVDQNELTFWHDKLEVHLANKRFLLLQEAKHGQANVPLSIVNQLKDEEAAIKSCQIQLQNLLRKE